MFPLTHIWFSEKVLGYKNRMSVLGAVFPDTVTIKCLSHEETHNCTWRLYDYVMEECSDCSDFAKAMVTHTVNPKGLDYYGDECYGSGNKGYCFQKGEAVVLEVIKACNIPEEFGLWKAHNFVEMGIEINIARANKELRQVLNDTLGDSAVIRRAASCLEGYYSMEEGSLACSITNFARFLELKDTSSYSLACKYNIQMKAKHGIEINIGASADIIDKCSELVKADFDSFIGYCAENVSAMIGVKDNE